MASLTHIWIEADLVYLQSTGTWTWEELAASLRLIFADVRESSRRVWLLVELSQGAPDYGAHLPEALRALKAEAPPNLAYIYIAGLPMTPQSIMRAAIATQGLTADVTLVKHLGEVFELRRISSRETRVSAYGKHMQLA